jgi:hypothetical protein
LNCNARDTLICYDIFQSQSNEPIGTPGAPIEVIDVDNPHRSKVIDLLSDTDEEYDVTTDESDQNLAMLVSMGFQTNVALQALRAKNGDLALATQRLLDGVDVSGPSSSSSSSSSTSMSTSTSPSKRRRTAAASSIFDGHPGIQGARRYIATADEFDEAVACRDLPRHGVLLEHVSARPLEYYKALLCRNREIDDEEDRRRGGGVEWSAAIGTTTTLMMRADQAADLATLEEEFEESDILGRAEIRQMFVVMDHNVESTRNALLSG